MRCFSPTHPPTHLERGRNEVILGRELQREANTEIKVRGIAAANRALHPLLEAQHERILNSFGVIK